MDKDERFVNKCFKEMFKRVGEVFPNHELTVHEDWYSRRTWTEKEQKSYKNWLVKEFKKAFPYLKRKAEFEVDMFILCYGWKTKED